jgi:redox-sensitive bicupin YhaK (pirin superfamily)
MTTKILRSVHAIEGADMPVRRAFAAHGGVSLDPFLMLDHFGPARLTPASQGFPAHPHKGFETVTYMFSGGIEHNDSFGGHAVIGPGDVQWMTAGSGIVHSETPPDDMRHGDVTVEGLQVWVNLPKAKKLHAPGYVVLKGDELPRRLSHRRHIARCGGRGGTKITADPGADPDQGRGTFHPAFAR